MEDRCEAADRKKRYLRRTNLANNIDQLVYEADNNMIPYWATIR